MRDVFHRLDVAVSAFFGDDEQPPPTNVSTLSAMRKGEKRGLSTEDVEGFHRSAESREPTIFLEMDALLRELMPRNPIKAARIRREIKWLRQQAYKNGLWWGVKKRGLF